MIDWLKRLFRLVRWGHTAAVRTRRGVVVVHDDPHGAEVIAAAWLTGKPVVGRLDDEGRLQLDILGENE